VKHFPAPIFGIYGHGMTETGPSGYNIPGCRSVVTNNIIQEIVLGYGGTGQHGQNYQVKR